ncbi:FG-GAP repeat domain-containing protein [Propionibacteriaceae bacterium G1746]
MRIRRSLLAVGAAASLLLGLAMPAAASVPTASEVVPQVSPAVVPAAVTVKPGSLPEADCLAANYVWVLVVNDKNEQSAGCATEFGTGMTALASAGFTVGQRSGFINTLDGYPDPIPAGFFWSYWSGAVSGAEVSWTFYSVGAASSKPKPGTVEAWHYVSWQTGPAQPPVWQPTPKAPAQVATPVTGVKGDQNGDKVADVYAVDQDGVLMVFTGSTTRELTWQGRVGTGWDGMTHITQIADIDGDKRSDLLARRGDDNSLWLFRGVGNGYLTGWKKAGQNWGGMDMIVPVGSLDGGPTQYVVARRAADGALFRYTLTPQGLTGIKHIGQNWGGMRQLLSVGDFSGDGLSDLLAIREDGTLWSYRGTATGGISWGQQVGRGWTGFTLAFSPGDLSGDGRGDLVGQRDDGAVFAYTNRVGSWSGARQILTGAQGYVLMA